MFFVFEPHIGLCADSLERTRGHQRNTNSTGNTMALNPYLSIITLNVNGLHAPIKDIGYQMDKKIKIHLYTAYKRLILDLRTPSD